MRFKQGKNGKQCTIKWHVDNLKISPAEKYLVESIISDLNKKFGKESLLTTTHDEVSWDNIYYELE